MIASNAYAQSQWSPLTAYELAENVRGAAETGERLSQLENTNDLLNGKRWVYKMEAQEGLSKIGVRAERVMADIRLRQRNDVQLCNLVSKLYQVVEATYDQCFARGKSEFCNRTANLSRVSVDAETLVSYIQQTNVICQVD